MPTASTTLHESREDLRDETVDRHRALVSLMEELEAIDWYDQRVDATDEPELRAILAHNRDEEKEHAAMVLEWLRRRDDALAKHLRTYLFSTEPITEIEDNADDETGGGDKSTDVARPSQEEGAQPADGSLGIGSLKGGAGL